MTNEAVLNGIRVHVRMLITHAPEQRFDETGRELLQFRGEVLGAATPQPELVVRFGGQQRAELFRWARQNKHLSVEGWLDVKTWQAKDGHTRVALLIDAQSLYVLNDLESDLSKVGVYDTQVAGSSTVAAVPKGKAARAELLRTMLRE